MKSSSMSERVTQGPGRAPIEQRHDHEDQDHAGHDHAGHAHAPGKADAEEKGHSHDHSHTNPKIELLFALLALAGTVIGWVLGRQLPEPTPTWALVPYFLTYFFGSYYTLRESFDMVRHGKLGIESLMLVAAIGAAFLGEWFEGALLLTLFSLGHALEHHAMGRARQAIESLAKLAPEEAIVLRDGAEVRLPVEELLVGDRVRVKPDERLPADGVVIEGESAVDQAPITGESVPVDKRALPAESQKDEVLREDPAHRVFAGSINGSGALTVEVTRLASQSALARVVQLVAEAEQVQSPTQRTTARFEKIFVPSILIFDLLLLVGAPLLLSEPFSQSFYRAMAVLVAASPCALAIATPSAVLSAVAAAGRAGVLIKGGAPLEHLGEVSALAFDKTGTLTEGSPRVTQVALADGVSEQELIEVSEAVERGSAHPLARAVVAHAEAAGFAQARQATALESITGKGVQAMLDGAQVVIGKPKLFGEDRFPALPPTLAKQVHALEAAGQTVMVVLHGDRYLGAMALMDTARPGAKATLERLRELGITKMIMISGDNQAVASAIAAEVGLDQARGELMPQDKVRFIEELSAQHQGVAMVGDGVNDAPAMAHATVGIAMGAAGSDTALETASIALMSDDLSRLPFAVELARKSSRIIRQNLWLSVGMIGVLVPATLFGLEMSPAVALHEGSTLVVVFNALRLLAMKPEA